CVVEAELRSVEVTILHPGIQIRSQRIPKAGNSLEGPGAVAVARKVRPRTAGTAAGIATEAAAEIAVEQGVGHQRLDADVVANAEVGRRSGGPGGSADVRDQRRADPQALHSCALVSGLAFEPDRAELVPEDRIDVVAGLVIDLIAVVVSRCIVE